MCLIQVLTRELPYAPCVVNPLLEATLENSIFDIKKYFFLTVAIVVVVELKKEKCVLGPGASLKYYN